jgi:amidohydrolase family protein
MLIRESEKLATGYAVIQDLAHCSGNTVNCVFLLSPATLLYSSLVGWSPVLGIVTMLQIMNQTRRRFLTSTGVGSFLAARALIGQTARPPLPSVEIGEALELLAIRNVTVIDMTGKPPILDATVLLDGSRIASVGAPDRIAVPRDTMVLDGTGKFLIPGLWDMHTHRDMRRLPLFVANGVTGIRCMQAFSDDIEGRDEIAVGRRLGPQMAAGLYLNGPDRGQTSHDWRVVSTSVEAREAVRRGRREGYDFIKVYNLLPREAYFAIMEEARQQGLPVVGHVPRSVTPAECSNSGQRSIEHVFQIAAICMDGYDDWRKTIDVSKPWTGFEPIGDSFQLSRAVGLAQTIRKNKTWLCPTLIDSELWALGRDPRGSDDPRLKYVSNGMKTAWDHPAIPSTPRNRREHPQYMEIVRMLHKAGVGILAGTDVPSVIFTFPGFSLHEELELLVSAGLTHFDALRAATSGPAEFFGKSDRLGTVEAGKHAELVLLDADPLVNISNTQRINSVFTNGRVYRRPALDKMLEFAEADARN